MICISSISPYVFTSFQKAYSLLLIAIFIGPGISQIYPLFYGYQSPVYYHVPQLYYYAFAIPRQYDINTNLARVRP